MTRPAPGARVGAARTEKAAWRMIGEAFEEYATTGQHRMGIYAEVSRSGLCWAITEVTAVDPVISRMALTLAESNPGSSWFWWPIKSRAAALKRAIHAYFLAESCDD